MHFAFRSKDILQKDTDMMLSVIKIAPLSTDIASVTWTRCVNRQLTDGRKDSLTTWCCLPGDSWRVAWGLLTSVSTNDGQFEQLLWQYECHYPLGQVTRDVSFLWFFKNQIWMFNFSSSAATCIRCDGIYYMDLLEIYTCYLGVKEF